MATVSGADKVMRELERLLKKLGGGTVAVGFPEQAKYGNGTPIAQAAWWDEYGHGGQFPAPPRPFFRGMIAEESPGWPAMMAGALKYAGNDTTKALGLAGQKVAGQLRTSIADYWDVPLSPTTLRLREKYTQAEFDAGKVRAAQVIEAQREAAEGYPLASGSGAKPLVHSGQLLGNVHYWVNTK